MEDAIDLFDKIRMDRRLSQQATAEQLGTDPAQLCRILKRKQLPGRSLSTAIWRWSGGLITPDLWDKVVLTGRDGGGSEGGEDAGAATSSCGPDAPHEGECPTRRDPALAPTP